VGSVADKTLLIKLKVSPDGTPYIASFNRSLSETAGAEKRLRNEMAETNREASRQGALMGGVSSGLGRLLALAGGTAAIGLLAKKTFDYNQELESTKNSIAGLLFANEKYVNSVNKAVDADTSWMAAQADASQLMARLQIESLKTAATVPQIADAFGIVYSAIQSAGQSTKDLESIITLTTRLTQTANAFHIPMEQIRQEINSMLTGQITSDSILAKKLGLTNSDIRKMQGNHKLVLDMIKRTEPYARAADAQSNTVLGKMVNTGEAIISTLSRAFDPVIQRMKGGLDTVFNFFADNGNTIAEWVQRVAAAVEKGIGKLSEFIKQHAELLKDIAAVGAIAGVAVGGFLLISAVLTALTSPITLVIAGIVALAYVWEKARAWSQIVVNGRPIAAYVRATFEEMRTFVVGDLAIIRAAAVGTWTTFDQMGRIIFASGHLIAAVAQLVGQVLVGVMGIIGAFVNVLTTPFRVAAKTLSLLSLLVIEHTNTVKHSAQSIVGSMNSFFQPIVTIVKTVTWAIGTVVNTFFNALGRVFEPLKTIAKSGTLALLIPGVADVKIAVTELFDAFANFSPAGNFQKELDKVTTTFEEGVARMNAAYKDGSPLGLSPSELVSTAWTKAKSVLEGLIPQLEKTGNNAMGALAGVHRSGAGGGATKLTEQQQKQLADFKAWLKQLEIEAKGAGGDALLEKIASIEKKRVDTIADAHKKATEALGAIDATLVKKAEASANTIAGKDLKDAVLSKVTENEKRILDLRRELRLDAQKDADEDYISHLHDALQKELEQNRAANRQWAAEKHAAIDEVYGEQIRLATRTAEFLSNIDEEWAKKALDQVRSSIAALTKQQKDENDAVDADTDRRQKRAVDRAEEMQRQMTIGTKEWAQAMADAVEEQFGTIPEILKRAFLDSRNVIATSLNGFLDDLSSGQASIGKSFGDLVKGMASTWNRAFTDMLAGGHTLTETFANMWAALGGTDHLMYDGPRRGATFDNVVAGAGVGAFFGGIFQKPGNNAQMGGAVGGAIGAVVGSLIPGIGTAIGAIVGSLLGTLVGTMIQKGKDSIKVAITGITAANAGKAGLRGVAGEGQTKIDLGDGSSILVTEKGISPESRNAIAIQIKRRVREEMHGWQSILDMFPDEVKKALVDWKATLNLSGGVESADITDEGALNTLTDFLGNKLPKAAFSAYEGGLRIAFKTMGVGSARMDQLFARWGELQGQELQNAVKDFATTLLETVNQRDAYKTSFKDRNANASKENNVFDTLDDFDSRMAMAVASMQKLTDVDDIIAAQKEVNDLNRQRLDYEAAQLKAINQMFNSAREGNLGLKEQIKVSGMDDQGKLNFFYDRLAQLRTQLLTATDPDQINRINQQMQQYVQQAFGLAGDNAENRSKLMAILDDMNSILDARQSAIDAAIEERDKRPATLLEQAAQALMQAAADLSGTKPQPVPKNDPPTGTGDPNEGDTTRKKTPRFRTTNDMEHPNSAAAYLAMLTEVGDEAGLSTAAGTPPHARGDHQAIAHGQRRGGS
jgi:hypothetical protein